jgi:hypothetical protein
VQKKNTWWILRQLQCAWFWFAASDLLLLPQEIQGHGHSQYRPSTGSKAKNGLQHPYPEKNTVQCAPAIDTLLSV